ncbi:Protein aveugle [Gryllus bimaculatus]|nr:Protein aveugle [Gryllus bimaculatus]
MVEETNAVNKPKNRTARPRPVYLWTVQDVQKWLKRHCTDYYPLYSDKFQQHEITGRTLLRINESTLMRLGIDVPQHRQVIWRQILKLRLKMDIVEIRDLERRNNMNYD